MSCEARHHDIVARLLSLAGLHDTDADTVMGVGVGKRRRRGGLPTPDAAATVPLHADAQHALEITGHSDHATPSWVAALIDRLHTAAERGSRRAFLTLRWLTDGWEEVMPHLTEDDRAWFMIATRCGIQVPPACEAWLAATRPRATIGRLLAHPVRDAVVLTELLDALVGIDDVSPDAVQTVTPLQVLRFLLGGSFPSRTDLQQVLRAVLTDAPVVRETVTQLENLYGPQNMVVFSLPYRLVGRASRVHGHSVEQAGGDAVLEGISEWIRLTHRVPIDSAMLHNPSPEVMTEIATIVWRGCSTNTNQASVTLTTLLHIWQRGGRNDAVAQMVRTLVQSCATNWDDRCMFPMIVAAIVAGVIRPPHGDALMLHLTSTITTNNAWSALTAGAIYAAACQSIEHVPPVDGIENIIRIQWHERLPINDPSPIPLLAVGRERELLLPALHAARGTAVWLSMLLDVIDAMDMLDRVGGDPQALLAVLTDALPTDGGDLDPQICIRLAASRCGRAILANLPVTTIPPIRDWYDSDRYGRVIPHLVSPEWATAPPHLRAWWEQTCRQIATAKQQSFLLGSPPPLYPTVIPETAVTCPTAPLVARAVAHPQWDDLPAADRQGCLMKAFHRMIAPEDVLAVAMRAATATTIQDVVTALPAARYLSERCKGLIHHLIAPRPRRSA